MSTKTIYKRIALVAVATLGAGLLSVAPASAAITAFGASKTGALPAASTTAPTSVGTSITADLNIITTGASEAAVTAPFTWSLINPNGLDVTSSVTFANTGLAAGITSSTFTGTAGANTVVVATGSAAGTRKVGTMTFVPAMGGRYELQFARAASTGEVVNATTIAAATTPDFFVSGSGAVVAASGVGTTTVEAVTGGVAQIRLTTAANPATGIYNLTTSGVGSIQTVVNGQIAPGAIAGIAAATDFTQGARITTTNDNTVNQVLATVNSAVAGTQTLTWTAINAATGAPTVVATQVITWGAAPVLSAALSTAFLGAGNLATVTANVSGGVQSINTAQTAAASAAASIDVLTRNSAGTSLLATQTITVTVTGPGTVSIGATNGGASQGRAITGTAGQRLIHVFGDGTSGTSTITISQGTTVISTKTVTFYGAVATLTAVQNHRIANSAGGPLGSGDAAAAGTSILTTPAVVISAKDVNGNAVPGLTITAVTSDATVMTTGITVAGVTATPGNYNVAVNSAAKASGSTATLTFRVMSGTTVLAATAPLTYTLGGGVSTVALSLDAASYDAGAPAVATLTLKDSSGNPAWDNDYAGILAGALTSSLAVTAALQFNAAANTSVSSLGGVSTVKLNAPGTSASAWTISGTTGAGPGVDKAKALSATAAVTNASADAATDAANEATDAANAATDAALAAADAADAATAAAQDAADAVAALSTRVSTLVSNLRKQITALTKLVQRLL